MNSYFYKLIKLKIKGIFFTLGGTILIILFHSIFNKKVENHKSTILGMIFVLTSVTSFAIYLMIMKIFLFKKKNIEIIKKEENKELIDINKEEYDILERNNSSPSIQKSNLFESSENINSFNNSNINLNSLNESNENLNIENVKYISENDENINNTSNLSLKSSNNNSNFNLKSLNESNENLIENINKENLEDEKPYPPFHTMFWIQGYSFICFSAVLLYMYIFEKQNYYYLNDSKIIFPVLFSSFIATCLSHTLLIYVNKISTPVFIQIFQPVQMIITMILSYIYFDDKLILSDYIGSIFVIIGLFLVTFSSYFELKNI
jgi:uncharacterized membrane protein